MNAMSSSMLRSRHISSSLSASSTHSVAAVSPAVVLRPLGVSCQQASASTSQPTSFVSSRRSTCGQQGFSRRVIACSFAPTESAFAEVLQKLKEQEKEQLRPLPTDVEGANDDPTLHNPLARMARLGTNWFGVLMEFEGVVVESNWESHQEAWLKVAAEFGYSKPLHHVFRRIRGVREDIVISRIFGWSHNPTTIRQLVERKAAIIEELQGGRQPALILEVRPFLEMLRKFDVPVALVSGQPEKKVVEALARHGLDGAFDAVVTAEDSGAPEVEYSYVLAASKIKRPPLRCVVVGESNSTVEAAHELGMKCVVPAGHKPVYEFVGADLVVRHLGQVAFLNMKKLFGEESAVKPRHIELEDASSSAPPPPPFGQPAPFSDEDDFGFDDEEEDEINAPYSRSRGAFL